MMTPTAIIAFNYELMFADGSKDHVSLSTTRGAYEACAHLEKHGVNLSYSTILNSAKARIYAIDKLPYRPDVKTNKDVINHFDLRYGVAGINAVVNVHLQMQRHS